MSQKVHLISPDVLGVWPRVWRWSRCGRLKTWLHDGQVPDADRPRLLEDGAFAMHQTRRQCCYCREKLSAAAQRHILSVSLFCGALAGAIDDTLATLIAEPDPSVALDLAEQRGLDRPEGWAGVMERQAWLEVDLHQHVWLPWRNGDETRCYESIAACGGASRLTRNVHRCPCGVFEHEMARCSSCDLSLHEHRLHRGRDCGAFAFMRRKTLTAAARARLNETRDRAVAEASARMMFGLDETAWRDEDIADLRDDRAAMDEVARDAAR